MMLKKDSSISGQRADLMIGPFWVLVAVHSGFFIWEPLYRIYDFLDHVKEGMDISREYNVTKWGEVRILACNSNRFYRVQQILRRWKSSTNPKILKINFYRRVPGLGTALTKTAMKDIEEQGVKVGIIFNGRYT